MSETEPQSGELNPDNLLKILVATDNHLGYNEKDHLRGNDSFTTFEEILQYALQHEVDFILLGGDLFHDAKPSPNTLQRCMQLLRTYTLGDKAIGLEFLSNQEVNFVTAMSQSVNYEDPNMNIAYPVFSIHGNHDDPSGFGRLSALDLLSTNGLVNYFGKWTDLTKINITPILLRKGATQLALYGLSYIQDCRLARLFEDNKVVLEKPDPEAGDGGEWFNLMVLHQNRADRGPKNFLQERLLPPFIDLFVWGHEHDCRIVPESNTEHQFYVSQPGSSVATSLCEGEALPKHCGLLLVQGTQFKLEPIKLQTVRPFVFDSMDLSQYENELSFDEPDAMQRIQDFIALRIEEMIKKAAEQLTGHPAQPKLPLIRLRVVYNAEVQMFNAIRYGSTYYGRVANPIDMILFKKQKKSVLPDVLPVDKGALNAVFNQGEFDEHTRVEDIVNRYFAEADATAKLEVLFPKSMNEICRRLVDHDDDDALEVILKTHHDRACAFLNNIMPAKEDAEEHLVQLELEADDMYEEAIKKLNIRGGGRSTTNNATVVVNTTTSDAGRSSTSVSAPAPPLFSPVKPKPTAANKRTAAASSRATTSTRGGVGSRGGRGGRTAANTRNKSELNISISTAKPSAESTIIQPSIKSSFAAQSQTRQSQRNVAPPARNTAAAKFTQYISDSDSD